VDEAASRLQPTNKTVGKPITNKHISTDSSTTHSKPLAG